MKTYTTLMVLLTASVCSAELPKYTVKTAKADVPSGVSKEIQGLLQTDAVQVSDDHGAGVLKIWFVKAVSSSANAEQIKNGLTYREWTEGSIVGVVQVEQPWVDYRKQSIAAGIYTLRIAFQPDTGDHKDTAPGTEFLLLCPVDADTGTEALATNDLVKLSKRATGGDHASVMLLMAPKDAGKMAELKTSDNALSVRMQIPVKSADTSGTVGVQVVVWGHSTKR
jgi:hypothetical protein